MTSVIVSILVKNQRVVKCLMCKPIMPSPAACHLPPRAVRPLILKFPQRSPSKNFIYDPQDERFAVVVSTNNLLLNAYRQVQAGPDIFICLDTSYRYNTAGWGLMPIGTMDRTATGHTIAYALVSKEDHKVHEFVLSAVKKHVERVVNESCT
jgi:hypothetical protein